MRFMILVKASQDSEAGRLPSEELPEAMGEYSGVLDTSGVALIG